jgi:hypothetical protein
MRFLLFGPMCYKAPSTSFLPFFEDEDEEGEEGWTQ